MTIPTIHDAWTSSTSKTATITWTAGAANRMLILCPFGEVNATTDPAVTALSVGGTDATPIGAAQSQFAASPGVSCSMWRLMEADLTALGTSGALVLTDGSTSTRFAIFWATYKDVEQTTPVDNSNGASFSNSGGVTNTTLSTAAGDAVGIAGAMSMANSDTVNTWGDSWTSRLLVNQSMSAEVADKSTSYTAPSLTFQTITVTNRVIRAAVLNGVAAGQPAARRSSLAKRTEIGRSGVNLFRKFHPSRGGLLVPAYGVR